MLSYRSMNLSVRALRGGVAGFVQHHGDLLLQKAHNGNQSAFVRNVHFMKANHIVGSDCRKNSSFSKDSAPVKLSRNGSQYNTKNLPNLRDIERVSEVLEIYENHSDKMSPKEMSLCWNRIAAIIARNGIERINVQRNTKAIENMLQHTIRIMPTFQPSTLCSTANSLAKISTIGRKEIEVGPEVWDCLEDQLLCMTSSLSPKDISMAIWAFAKVGYGSDVLYEEISKACISKLRHFNPQGFSNTVWAFAAAGHYVPKLFEAMADASLENLEKFDPQNLANMAWAYATVRHSAPFLFDNIGEVSIAKLETFNAQEMAIMAWAFAAVKHSSPNIFKAIADESITRLDSFNPQNLANLAWAFATVGHVAPTLFDAIADVSIPRLGMFNQQDIANMVWAFSNVEHPAPVLFDAIADASIPKLDRFKPQALVTTAWSYATARHAAPLFFDAIADASVPKLEVFKTQDMVSTVSAYAAVGHSNQVLFDAIADASLARLDTFNPQNLANTVWAFATVGKSAPLLFDAIVDASLPRIYELRSKNRAKMAWSYAVFDHSFEIFTDKKFVKIFYSKDSVIPRPCKRQLHQVQLWCLEHNVSLQLDPDLLKECEKVFFEEQKKLSRHQRDVVDTLCEMGFQPDEEIRTESGYLLHAVVTHGGQMVGIDVDGPSRYLSDRRSPSGFSKLKRRQLLKLEHVFLLSVPDWEWGRVKAKDLSSNEEGRKWRKRYLMRLLNNAIIP